MPKLPSLTPQKLIKILKKKGFKLDRVKGSHIFTTIQKAEKKSLFHSIKKICPREHY